MGTSKNRRSDIDVRQSSEWFFKLTNHNFFIYIKIRNKELYLGFFLFSANFVLHASTPGTYSLVGPVFKFQITNDTDPEKLINPFFGFHFRGVQVNLAVDLLEGADPATATTALPLLAPMTVAGDSWDYFSRNLTKAFLDLAGSDNETIWRLSLRVTAEVLPGGHLYLDNFGMIVHE